MGERQLDEDEQRSRPEGMPVFTFGYVFFDVQWHSGEGDPMAGRDR